MTLPANSKAFSESLPSDEAQDVAKHLLKLLAAQKDGDINLYAHPKENEPLRVDLHPMVSDALMEVLRYISNGDAVTLIPINKQLTTQQAADVLNVSRPYLIKLLEAGKIPFTKVNRHRRIAAGEIFDYKSKRDEARKSALEALAEQDAELI